MLESTAATKAISHVHSGRKESCLQMCSVRLTFVYFLGITGSIALIAGCVILPLGLVQQAEASSADPSTDFALVGTCKISQVLHRAEERNDGSGGKSQGKVCYDIYTYKFLHQGDTFLSREELVLRSGRCDSSAQVAGTFSVGQDATCWQATGDVSELYGLNNDAGLKIFDPAAEFEAAANTAVVLTIVGGVLLPTSLLFLGVAVALFRCGGCDCSR